MEDEFNHSGLVPNQVLNELSEAKARISELELSGQLGELLVNAGTFRLCLTTQKFLCSANELAIFGLTGDFDEKYATIVKLIHSDDQPSYNAAIEAIQAGRADYSHRHRILRKDGEVRHVREIGSVVERAGERVLLGVTQDITELVDSKAVELDLQRMIEFAGELSKVGGWKVDLKTETVSISPVTASFHDIPDLQ